MDPISGCFNPHFDDIFLKVGLGFGDGSGVFTVPLDVPFWGRWMYVPRMPWFLYPSMTPLKTTMDHATTGFGQKNVNMTIPPKKCMIQIVLLSSWSVFLGWLGCFIKPREAILPVTGSSLKSRLGQLHMDGLVHSYWDSIIWIIHHMNQLISHNYELPIYPANRIGYSAGGREREREIHHSVADIIMP